MNVKHSSNSGNDDYRHENVWSFWASLKNLAEAKDWQALCQTLDVNTSFAVLAGHPMCDEVFNGISCAGKVEALHKMYERGYEPDVNDAAASLKSLVEHSLPAAAPAVIYLVKEREVNPEQALMYAAEAGRVDVLEALLAADCDVLWRGRTFLTALTAGHTQVVNFLYHQGAELFTTDVVKAVCFQKSLALTEVYDTLLEQEADKVKDRTPHVVACPLDVLARAGLFQTVVSETVEGKRPAFTFDALSREDETGVSILSILAGRGEADLLAEARLWLNRSGEMRKVGETLSSLGVTQGFDISAISAEIGRLQLKGRAANKLRPR